MNLANIVPWCNHNIGKSSATPALPVSVVSIDKSKVSGHFSLENSKLALLFMLYLKKYMRLRA